MASRRGVAALAAGLLGAILVFAASQCFTVLPASPAPAAQTHGASAPAPRIGGTAAGATFSARSTGSVVAAVALAAVGGIALIVQNKGGGHGEIGYHLALQLVKEKNCKVIMIQDSAAKMDKPPFNDYNNLAYSGVEVRYADLENGGLAAAMQGVPRCDYVFDNQNVCPKDVQQAVAPMKPKAYVYVSSGGMYKPVPEGPLLETTDVKQDNKQLGIERNAQGLGLPLVAFRPQYIYGARQNKNDYLDWFFDRILAGVEFPLPHGGHLRTTVSNAEDVAGMLSSVVGHELSAIQQRIFNCATDARLSHKEIVYAVAQACGKDPFEVFNKIVPYDPARLKGLDLPKKGKFPFRETHFGVGVDKAKDLLDWKATHTLDGDIKAYYEDYKKRGKGGSVDRDWDEAIIRAARGVPVGA